MQLDTRGFMDGALRGFDMMERHYQNQQSLRQADERMKMDKENHTLGLKEHDQQMRLRDAQEQRANEEYDLKYGAVGEDGKRTGGTYQEDRDRQLKLSDAQLAANQAQQKLSEYKLNQAKKADYIQSNLPLIKNAWDRFNKTGEVDDVLKSEYVAGGPYDPNRYLDKNVNQAFDVIETKLPELVQGKGNMNDPEFVNALGVMYQDNVKAVVGQQDPITGKTIKDAKLGGVNLAQDIDPNTPGDQPGLILTTMVNYGDGNWVAKPITNNRSTDQNDTVKVIPIEAAMQDITGQLGLRRQAATSKAYKDVFGEPDKTRMKEVQPKIDSAIIDLEKERAKALSGLDKVALTPEQYDASVQDINAQFDDAKRNVVSAFTQQSTQPGNQASTNVPAWANGDPQKIEFAKGLQAYGYDVGSMSTKEIDDMYKHKLKDIKAKEEKARSASIIQKVNEGIGKNPNYSYGTQRPSTIGSRGY